MNRIWNNNGLRIGRRPQKNEKPGTLAQQTLYGKLPGVRKEDLDAFQRELEEIRKKYQREVSDEK